MNSQEKVKQLIDLREKARLGGGLQKIEDQHSKGRLTVIHNKQTFW
ncbi:MAG: hypothetical protein NTY95_12580 [Bacteroidia bacterium]|jgi:acetyl-CoA carboxylase carboxyltransferase component|nr:hypothetical protein [Bacteroidia bacterium]